MKLIKTVSGHIVTLKPLWLIKSKQQKLSMDRYLYHVAVYVLSGNNRRELYGDFACLYFIFSVKFALVTQTKSLYNETL
jgi:hypothetical protein